LTQCYKHQHWDNNRDCWQCLTESQGTAFDVTGDFIEEQKQASIKLQGNDLAKPSKFSPYTKAQREKRRKEVARLHFEKGVPGVKIAELMKVDKNTIYADLRAIYLELTEPGVTVYDSLTRFHVRLEMQRARLEEYLSKERDIQTKLMIERQLTDIESKLLQAYSKIHNEQLRVWIDAGERINKYFEEKKIDNRVLTLGQLVSVSPRVLDSVLKVLRKERVIK
jgi:hypothetical protein